MKTALAPTRAASSSAAEQWHRVSVGEAYARLGSGAHGLSTSEAIRRLQEDGPNSLPESPSVGYWETFIEQFRSPLIYILLIAGVVVVWLGQYADGALIGFVLFFNAVVGAVQERRAQHTLSALKRVTETNATVLRDEEELVVPDRELVRGDVVLLEEGDRIPADARILSVRGLTVDESALTGESVPVPKHPEVIDADNLNPADQRNMVFRGTYVTSGSGTALVARIGASTIIGEVALTISSLENEAPLKKDIRQLSKIIIGVTVAVIATLFAVGGVSGLPLPALIATGVSLAVSVIPEGLPVVVTLILATGVWRMSKRNALVKKLQAVEALGQAKVIAVDKTGTVTENELVVRRLFLDDTTFEVTGEGYDPVGELREAGGAVEPLNHTSLTMAGRIAALTGGARVAFDKEHNTWQVSGDPTLAALFTLGKKIGFHHEDLVRESPLLAELPFDYRTRYRAVVHATGSRALLSVVGAPEAVLALSHSWWHGDAPHELTERRRKEFDDKIREFSSQGLRVLGMAFHENAPRELEASRIPPLTFLGLVGIEDTLRPEVHEAVQRARDAGMRVVMITGDHRETAVAIARAAGIFADGDAVMTGDELTALPDAALAEALSRVSVFARVTPEHKLRIIQGFRARGEKVAMTGDGVNDAPSLVAADLGVAMGKIGTEVAKEAADIVLLDDNFGSIVAAIEEGRGVYRTIQKVLTYLFSTSLAEVCVILGSVFLGLSLPLLPTQIIWLNFVTDGLLVAPLALQPMDRDLLMQKFRKPKRFLVSWRMGARIVLIALTMAAGVLGLFSWYAEGDAAKGWTIALTTLAVFQWFNAWNCRSERDSIVSGKTDANRYLIAATALAVGLQVLAVHHPFFQGFLNTVPLELVEWARIVGIGVTVVLVDEIRKAFMRRFFPD